MASTDAPKDPPTDPKEPKDKEEDDMPVAEEEEEAKPNGDDDAKDDNKEEEKAQPMFERIPKEDPGEHFADQYDDKKDPRGEPDEISFKWDKSVKDKKECNTQQMLYLMQIACDLHRRRVIERNKYFTSISRTDRYIDHVDTPLIITNFLKWHNEDKDKNVLLGKFLTEKSKLFMINDMISDIGGIKKGPATRVYSKLKKEVMIEHDSWTDSNNKLKLYTWGMKKMYTAEKVLDECTVEDVVTLFTYKADDDQKEDPDADTDADVVDGVFAQFEAKGGAGFKNIAKVDGWKDKIVDWIRKNEVDGKKMTETAPKNLTPGMKSALIPDDELNEKGKQKNKVLGGPCGRMLTICKKIPVHMVLTAAQAVKK